MTLDDLTWPRRTARLTLRRARDEDADAVYRYRCQEGVSRWLTQIQTNPETWAAQWSLRLPTSVVVECDGMLIGDGRIILQDGHGQAEVADQVVGVEAQLAWAFDPLWHGRGYATEAVTELIRVSFSELGLRRIVTHCYADNEQSWRLMERLGMRRESHSVASMLHRDGTWRDRLDYALLASEV